MLKTSQQFRQIPELSVSYVLEGTPEWLGVSGFWADCLGDLQGFSQTLGARFCPVVGSLSFLAYIQKTGSAGSRQGVSH